MTPSDALVYLQSFPDWERGTAASEETYTLDRMRRLLELLDHPDRAYDIVHVVGTKGKGSTAAMIASCLRSAGYRAGLFTSPHLVDYRERVRVDGALIPPEALATIVQERLRPAMETLRAAGERVPLHFELLCALAFEHFRRSGVRVAVVEAGLGGRLDATNAVAQTTLTVITTLGYDHMAVLGHTLAEIAAEKAAVIRPGGQVVCAPQPPEAMSVIERICQERDAQLTVIGRDWRVGEIAESAEETTFTVVSPTLRYEQMRLPLAGAHQAINGAVAIAVLTALRPRYERLDRMAMRWGLAQVTWPGRMQVAARDPLVLLDGAHNSDSAAALAGALQRLYPEQRFVLVVGVFGDKDAAAILAPLLPLASCVVATATEHPRALPAEKLAAAARTLGAVAVEAPSVAAALDQARAIAGATGRVLVTGSLRTVGEAMQALGTLV